MSEITTDFDLDCPRLATFLEVNTKEYPDYHTQPVQPFGFKNPKLSIIGLVTVIHVANNTRRLFTSEIDGLLGR